MKPITELLNSKHTRDSFDCGIDSLNRYLIQIVNQNQKKTLCLLCII